MNSRKQETEVKNDSMRIKKLNQLIKNLLETEDELDAAIEEVFESGEGIQELTEDEVGYLDRSIFKCQCCKAWYHAIDITEKAEICISCCEYLFLDED